MNIDIVKVKQYNSTYKRVLIIDGVPVCIVASDKRANECIQYINGYDTDINDGKIKKILDKYRKDNGRVCQDRNGCICCRKSAYVYYKNDDNNAYISEKGIMVAEAEYETISFKVKYCSNCGRKF